MFKKNKIEDINKVNDSESTNKFIKNSKILFKELLPIYNKNVPKINQNIIFKNLSHIQFGIFILPYLSLKEILSLRATNKEMNLLINTNICCINYYFKTLKKNISFTDSINLSQKRRQISSQLKPFHELNDESEFIEQKNILNKIKDYMKSKNFSLDYLMQIYRVEMDYLKYEENHQERYMNSLKETQTKINDEYQLIKGKNKRREESWVKITKEDNSEETKIDENKLKELSYEELKTKIKELKMKKENILFKLNNARKTNEEINSKNNEKIKIINKLKNMGKNKEIEEDNENSNSNIEEINKFLKNI